MIAGRRWNADGGGHGWIWREIAAGQPGVLEIATRVAAVLEIASNMRRVEGEANAAVF
jgi:hypothetical protein